MENNFYFIGKVTFSVTFGFRWQTKITNTTTTDNQRYVETILNAHIPTNVQNQTHSSNSISQIQTRNTQVNIKTDKISNTSAQFNPHSAYHQSHHHVVQPTAQSLQTDPTSQLHLLFMMKSIFTSLIMLMTELITVGLKSNK